jgi:hypothetical protein
MDLGEDDLHRLFEGSYSSRKRADRVLMRPLFPPSGKTHSRFDLTLPPHQSGREGGPEYVICGTIGEDGLEMVFL